MGDRSWIDKPINSKEFLNGIVQFLDFAFSNSSICGQISCPCKKCGFQRWGNRVEVLVHLLQRGFPPKYRKWYIHGEKDEKPNVDSGDNGEKRKAICLQNTSKRKKLLTEDIEADHQASSTLVPRAFERQAKTSENLEEHQDHAALMGVPSKVSAEPTDAIVEVFGPEYPGCVRNLGVSVCPSSVFGLQATLVSSRNTTSISCDKEAQNHVEDLANQMNTLQENLAEYEETKIELSQNQAK